ncbi:MAG: sensor histidine kinase [Fretibacterium sp.]|nr:sensor histidine kinase [Fretibacterium sp.]
MLKRIKACILGPLKPEKRFWVFLLCALIGPPITILLLAAFAHVSQERAMEAAMSSYVQDLAEGMAYHLGADVRIWDLPYLAFGKLSRYYLFCWGPSIPGWVAHISNDGKIIMASPGADNIVNLWREGLPIGTAVRIKDKKGAEYTLAIYPVNRGQGYVVAAVSWDQLLGRLVQVGRSWPFLVVLMALCSFGAIRMLWRRLVWPLQDLAAEIDALRVGKDLPNPLVSCAVQEIESMHGALMRFARAAIERDNLRNSYVQDIIHAQETERMDMAREIHDGPLQDITALLQQIHMSLEEDAPKERIKKTECLAKAVVKELRGLCDELAPPWLDLGLSDAMLELTERLSQTYDIHVYAEIDEDFDLAPEQTLSLVRVFQEAVSNAVRHGGAANVRARLFKENEILVFEIQDDGKGFSMDSAVTHETLRLAGHRGLANMTERMSLMNGSFTIHSELEKGTRIRCTLPLA